ncbi:MAG: hypothetical protein WCP45_00005, partial [Verrucomicrobiota bacterium]
MLYASCHHTIENRTIHKILYFLSVTLYFCSFRPLLFDVERSMLNVRCSYSESSARRKAPLQFKIACGHASLG